MKLHRIEKKGVKIFAYSILSIAIVLFLFPIVWMVITSFKFQRDIMTDRIIFIPKTVTVKNYKEIFSKKLQIGGDAETVFSREGHGLRGLKNSLIISTSATLLSLIIGLPAAYALARFRVKKKDALANWILSTRMFPPAATVLPIFLLWQRLRLIDTYFSMIFSYLVFSLPFVIWIMRGFFYDIPNEIEESAFIDGCGVLRGFLKISIPLTTPGIAATAVFCYMFSWNEFLFGLILSRIHSQTYPVQLAGYIGTSGILWGQMSAMAVLAVTPVVILLIFTQRYMVRGLSFGSIR
jgi:multiple sugar transport system permease protein